MAACELRIALPAESAGPCGREVVAMVTAQCPTADGELMIREVCQVHLDALQGQDPPCCAACYATRGDLVPVELVSINPLLPVGSVW
jgi:hypothetical protein